MLRKPKRRPTPSNWASYKPLGIGEERPNNYREVFGAVRENRDAAGYAWRILTQPAVLGRRQLPRGAARSGERARCPGADPAERVRFADTGAIREEIARVVPLYRGIEKLHRQGDQFQYGGAHLCAGWEFPTADGRARFSTVKVPEPLADDGLLALATRRGKQFNSMVQERRDSLTGAVREAVLISAEDAERIGIGDGDPVLVRSDQGDLRGIPDYNARVSVEPL